MKYSEVKEPIWSNLEKSMIDCYVNFDGNKEDFLPFTANPLDVANESSKEIFDRCVNGDFGTVADYIPLPVHINTGLENKQIAKKLLVSTDWVNEPDVIDTSRNPYLLNQYEFLTYRSAIRDIAVNIIAGNLDWPIEPKAQWS